MGSRSSTTSPMCCASPRGPSGSIRRLPVSASCALWLIAARSARSSTWRTWRGPGHDRCRVGDSHRPGRRDRRARSLPAADSGRAPAELSGDAPELARRLASAVPQVTHPVVVHGDYHFGNMLFAGGRVSAVLDWEIAELGHPLLDLCCLCVVFQGGSDGEARGWGPSRGLEPDALRDLFGADPAEFRWTLGLTYY